MIGAARSALGDTYSLFASVFRNPALRKLQFALLGSLIGDWASATALAVWVYGVGGAKAVGIYYTVRLLLMALSSPLTGTMADKLPRRLVMIGADLLRCVLFIAIALLIWAEASNVIVFVLFGIASLAISAFRPAQAAWLPSLANSAEELTAANGSASTLESLSFFVGPAIGAFMLSFTDVSTVFLVNAATFLWSAALVASVRVPHREPAQPRPAARAAEVADEPHEPRTFIGEIAHGFGTIRRDRDILMVGVLLCVQTIVAGASAVFFVVLAVEVLHTGPRGVGFLDSIFGVGAVIGGIVAIGRARRRKLAGDMFLGVVMWGLPLVIIWLVPHPVVVFAVMALMGFGNPLVDVNFATLVQRISPEEVLGRVFATLEGACILTMALGSFTMPFLVDWLGFERSLAFLGIVVTLLALPWLGRVRRLDARLGVPPNLPLLEAIPLFAPLTPATVESLARKLTRFEVPAGSTIIREGQQSDRFYIIERGSVAVSHGDTLVRHETDGDFFGEIGLLRDIPRTATITADEDTVLQVLERDDFLAAVTGQDDAHRAAEAVVSRRIAI
jgi:MFS family permease